MRGCYPLVTKSKYLLLFFVLFSVVFSQEINDLIYSIEDLEDSQNQLKYEITYLKNEIKNIKPLVPICIKLDNYYAYNINATDNKIVNISINQNKQENDFYYNWSFGVNDYNSKNEKFFLDFEFMTTYVQSPVDFSLKVGRGEFLDANNRIVVHPNNMVGLNFNDYPLQINLINNSASVNKLVLATPFEVNLFGNKAHFSWQKKYKYNQDFQSLFVEAESIDNFMLGFSDKNRLFDLKFRIGIQEFYKFLYEEKNFSFVFAYFSPNSTLANNYDAYSEIGAMDCYLRPVEEGNYYSLTFRPSERLKIVSDLILNTSADKMAMMLSSQIFSYGNVCKINTDFLAEKYFNTSQVFGAIGINCSIDL